jgi:hypothetical protein
VNLPIEGRRCTGYEKIKNNDYDLVLCDIKCENVDMVWEIAWKQLKNKNLKFQIVMISG